MKLHEVVENISHTSQRLKDIERNRDVKPGTEEWFNLWFSLPYLKENILLEGYRIQLERGTDMDVLHIVDTRTGKRTEVRGKPNYEVDYDPNDPLHQLLDKIGKAANISELINGEVTGINTRHPDGERATAATDKAFNEKITKRTPMGDVIKDFYKSDAPQFKGKSKKKRRQMAIAAKLAKMDEAFDTKVDWQKEGTRYTAMIGDKKVTIDYDEKPIYTGDKHEMGIEVNFSVDGRYDVTGTGDANAIFGAVYNHIAQWVGQVKPEVFEFSASKRASDSRASLYARMVKRFAAQLGYTHHKAASDSVSSSIGATFILLRNDIAKQRGLIENFKDGKVKGKSRPGRVKRAGASCNGSVTDLRRKAKKYSGEKGKMYHWCANMKAGRKK